MVVLYSKDEPSLKIGEPVTEVQPDGFTTTVKAAEVVFDRGFATVDWSDERIRTIVAHTQRTYPIEILEDPDIVAEETPGSVVCPECGKSLSAPIALRGHLRSHKPK
jgi:hypothetical protein